jgi:beta-carotene ketolase (CrtW type)
MKDNKDFSSDVKGITSAFIIILTWLISLMFLFRLDVQQTGWLSILLMLWQTFLYTGLFITAHDAMHGTVSPNFKKINKLFGRITLTGYAFFSFDKMLAKHREHHRHPASENDPDYHKEGHENIIMWYLDFIFNYISWKQIIFMAIAFNVFEHLFNIPVANLILFWVFPAILSTWQLFVFGTYLPHRDGEPNFSDPHRARSNDYSWLISFLSCYHFGYHWEHHYKPGVPWWRLPKTRAELRNG